MLTATASNMHYMTKQGRQRFKCMPAFAAAEAEAVATPDVLLAATALATAVAAAAAAEAEAAAAVCRQQCNTSMQSHALCNDQYVIAFKHNTACYCWTHRVQVRNVKCSNVHNIVMTD